MNRRWRISVLVVLCCCLVVILGTLGGSPGGVLAGPEALGIHRWVVGGGGGHEEAAPHALDGTIGQPMVGAIGVDSLRLGAGFWGGMGATASGRYRLYLPLTVRD